MSEINLKLITDEYLEDESGMSGQAEGIYFAKTTEDISDFMKESVVRNSNVTIQGSRTGICGGAVPDGGLVLNLSHMNRIERVTRMDSKQMQLLVQCGVTLCELETFFVKQLPIFGKRYYFPPNPTEDTATIGGVIACNSLGSHGNAVGSLKDYLIRLTVVERDGGIVTISGDNGQIEQYIGSEGKNGVIAEAEITLLVEPECQYALLCYFKENDQVFNFCERLEKLSDTVRVTSAEYMDTAALQVVSKHRKEVSEFQKIPELLCEGHAAALLLELCSASEDEMLEGLEKILEYLEEAGIDVDKTIVAEDETERVRLRLLKHAVIKAANMENQKTFRETGYLPEFYDVTLPKVSYPRVLGWIHHTGGPRRLIYGHILTGHLHLHLLETEDSDYGTVFVQTVKEQEGIMGYDFGMGKRRQNPF